MNLRISKTWGVGIVTALIIVCTTPARAKDEPSPPPFKYAAGTENLPEGCVGNLEVNPEVLTFLCSGGKVEIPYSSISEMEYRSETSAHIRKMKLKWKTSPSVDPSILKPKKNRFFTVVYRTDQTPHVLVLRVEPQAMRPYLAELELRSDKRVDVQSYDEN